MLRSGDGSRRSKLFDRDCLLFRQSREVAAAGLQSGDIITEVGGRPVVEGRDIVVLLLPFRPGDTVPLTVLRGGEELEIEVTLGELPDNP